MPKRLKIYARRRTDLGGTGVPPGRCIERHADRAAPTVATEEEPQILRARSPDRYIQTPAASP